MTERADNLVIELAKGLIKMMQGAYPGWKKAFVRFEASDGYAESKGSYIDDEGISIFDVLRHKEYFHLVRDSGAELRALITNGEKRFCVFLLTVDSNFDYRIDFEWDDRGVWRISKLDGGSGLPEGLKDAAQHVIRH